MCFIVVKCVLYCNPVVLLEITGVFLIHDMSVYVKPSLWSQISLLHSSRGNVFALFGDGSARRDSCVVNVYYD